MNLLIPREIIEWLDKNRKERSRQSFIVHILVTISKTGKFEI